MNLCWKLNILNEKFDNRKKERNPKFQNGKMELMPRTRRIRRELEPDVAKQEVKNISKLYSLLGYVVHVSTDTENGSIVHRIVASKGKLASIVVELEEVVNDKKGNGKEAPEPVAPQEMEVKRETKPEALSKKPRQVVELESVESPFQLESLRKEDIKRYVEQDETGIVPALVEDGTIVLENGAVKLRKWIDRDKYLHARAFFKRIGLKL